jgi:hypothetical protein
MNKDKLTATMDTLTDVALDYGAEREADFDAIRVRAAAVTVLLSAAVRLAYASGGGLSAMQAALNMIWSSIRVSTYSADGSDPSPTTNSGGGSA